MSSLHTSQLLSAALRHVEDAEFLLDRSPDQSWHLAGFGPECARKACLSERWLDRILGHDLDRSSDDLIAFSLAMDSKTTRYCLTDLSSRAPALRDWSVSARYVATGTRSRVDADELVVQASRVTYELTVGLWMDGYVAAEAL